MKIGALARIVGMLLSGPVFAAYTCPQDAVKLAADRHGYRLYPQFGYCEGLLREDHAAELQVFSFLTVAEVLIDATNFTLLLPGRSDRVATIRGASSARGTPYRFDASLTGGQSLGIDLQNIVKPARIDPMTLGFLATATTASEPLLVPLIISKGPLKGKRWPPEYSFVFRAGTDVDQVSYRVLDRSGKVRLENKVDRTWPAGTQIPITIQTLPAGLYEIQIRASQTGGSEAFLRRLIEIPPQ